MSDALAACFTVAPFGADRAWRARQFAPVLRELTRHHYDRCPTYRSILDGLGFRPEASPPLDEPPYLPIGLFKRFNLLSVAPQSVQVTLTSSGTTASGRSRIGVDRETSLLQMRALARIMASIIGEKPLPMLILDSPPTDRPSADYAARMVALRGFSLFAKGPPHYALTPDLDLNRAVLDPFIAAQAGRPFLAFGFTHIIWSHVLARAETRPHLLQGLTGGILIHGGGWKRLADQSIDNARFTEAAISKAGFSACHNYYGMVEQPGSIYLQCEQRHFHCSAFSEVFIRRAEDLSECAIGEPGLIQTASVLPRSYPGHNLLTEDLGVLRGEDDCRCGRSGKYFDVLGRAPRAAPKGCSDV